jgi:hypothetical protein
MLLSDYLNMDIYLDENGIFDPVLEKDSHFFINIQRLKKAETPEFKGSYQRINDFFRNIIKLLDKASQKNNTDIFYKQALHIFDFSEVNGICLGFAEDSTGAGFGEVLSKQVIDTAFEIVKVGVTDPEFFQLLPLFQDNVGPDRLSDMVATIILPDIQAYTKRIYMEYGINSANFPDKAFDKNGYLINPYKKCEVLLLPIEVLHKLPVAKSWEDIDSIISENNIIRSLMNQEVADEWTRWSVSQKKHYLRENIFKDSEICQQVVGEYCKEELGRYNPEDQIDYLLAKIWQRIEKLNIRWKTTSQINEIDSMSAALEIIQHFQNWVENNKGWEVIRTANSRNREKILQRIIHLSAVSYIKANNLSMSCEADEGRGPVDFKLSRGQDISIIEVKLSSNPQYLHGYEVQLEEYSKAEQTSNMVYVLVDLGNPGKITKLKDLHEQRIKQESDAPELIIIDATNKKTASKA